MYYVKKGTGLNRKVLKLGIFGDSGVGKTSILNLFLGLKYKEDIPITKWIDKIENKFVLNNGKEIKVIIWDVSGVESFRSMIMKNVKFSEGCVIVFDVTLKQSFENLSMWLDLIKKVYPNVMVFIFGNKVDYDKSEWEITNEEINKFIEEKKLKYFEVSAKGRIGINEGIEYIVNKLCEEKEYIVIPPRKKLFLLLSNT